MTTVMDHRSAVERFDKSIHGIGVFATRYIAEGEIVGEVGGDIIDDPDFTSDYCIDLGGSLSLEPHRPFRFLNHCCDPNCQLVILESDASIATPPSVVVEAKRPIQPEEELTIDYAWPAANTVACSCNSPNCRGWIVHPEDLDALLGVTINQAALSIEG